MGVILNPCISLKGIGKSYVHDGQSSRVISGIDFSVDVGDACAVVGASGSGKSTLLNIIGLLDFADEGEYLFMGRPVTQAQSDELASLRRFSRYLSRQPSNYAALFSACCSRSGFSITVPIGSQLRV